MSLIQVVSPTATFNPTDRTDADADADAADLMSLFTGNFSIDLKSEISFRLIVTPFFIRSENSVKVFFSGAFLLEVKN